MLPIVATISPEKELEEVLAKDLCLEMVLEKKRFSILRVMIFILERESESRDSLIVALCFSDSDIEKAVEKCKARGMIDEDINKLLSLIVLRYISSHKQFSFLRKEVKKYCI